MMIIIVTKLVMILTTAMIKIVMVIMITVILIHDNDTVNDHDNDNIDDYGNNYSHKIDYNHDIALHQLLHVYRFALMICIKNHVYVYV